MISLLKGMDGMDIKKLTALIMILIFIISCIYVAGFHSVVLAKDTIDVVEEKDKRCIQSNPTTVPDRMRRGIRRGPGKCFKTRISGLTGEDGRMRRRPLLNNKRRVSCYVQSAR